MRGIAALLVSVLVGCITNQGLGPGVLQNMSQPRRDPDPTADFTKEATAEDNPWVPEAERRAPVPGSRRELTERTAATIAAVLAGAVPALVWYGRFDENLLFERPTRPATPTTSASPPP